MSAARTPISWPCAGTTATRWLRFTAAGIRTKWKTWPRRLARWRDCRCEDNIACGLALSQIDRTLNRKRWGKLDFHLRFDRPDFERRQDDGLESHGLR